MNDTAAVEQDQQTEQDAPVSIMEHAAQFGPNAQPDTPEPAEFVPPNETAEQKVAREHHSAQQRRDRENGQFQNGRRRHRAASAQATPDDLAAIGELTRRIKSAEEADGAHIKQNPGESQRVFELRRRAELAESRRELATLRSQHAPAAQVARAEAKVERAEAKVETPRPAPGAFSEVEPDENDPKFGGDYGKYLRAAAAYDIRKENFEREHAQREQDAQQRELSSFNERVTRGRARYQDFDAVALAPWRQGEPQIPADSVTDRFIMEDDNGEEMLYHLRKHPQELDAILRLPTPLSQAKALSLLSQRFASSPQRESAGSTTSATPPSKVVLPPKPPNVVRTEAQRASDSPPKTDGSLSIAEHAKAFGPKPRR